MDPPDFGRLYERHSRDVFRFALYLTGHRQDAEDITAETFVRAWTAPGEIRVGTVKAYLLMIARNLNLDRWDRRRTTMMPLDSDMPDASPGPENLASERDEMRVALAALAKLPETDRAALLMRALGDLPYDAIAAALGTSIGAARVKVHRARGRLSELRDALRNKR